MRPTNFATLIPHMVAEDRAKSPQSSDLAVRLFIHTRVLISELDKAPRDRSEPRLQGAALWSAVLLIRIGEEHDKVLPLLGRST